MRQVGASPTPFQDQDIASSIPVTGHGLHTSSEEDKHTHNSDSDRAEVVDILKGGTYG